MSANGTLRMNAGYIITDSIHIGETEFVIGIHSTYPGKFVTWACKNGDNYFWGHYLTSREDAERDIVDRAKDQLLLLEHIRGRPSPVKESERGEHEK